MSCRIVLVFAVGMALSFPVGLSAQRGSAVAGFNALIQTPVGAFAPGAASTSRPFRRLRNGLQLLYGRWVDSTNAVHSNVGVGWTFLRGRTRTTVQLARQRTLNCQDCRGLLGGVDVSIALAEARSSDNELGVLLSINPALGSGHALGWDNWNANAMAVSLPLAATLPVGSNLQLIPFISPGAGVGHYSASGESKSNAYSMVAGGVTLNVRAFPIKFTAGARSYFGMDHPFVWGIGLSTLH